MCGVEMSGSKSKCTEELYAVKPLEDDKAFEIIGDREVWHPVWKGNINDKINALFIKNVIQRIWQNKKVSRRFSMCGQDWYLPFELSETSNYPRWKGGNCGRRLYDASDNQLCEELLAQRPQAVAPTNGPGEAQEVDGHHEVSITSINREFSNGTLSGCDDVNEIN